MPAIPIIAAVVTAGATIYSANKASSAAKAATSAQVSAADQATQLQRDIYTQNRADQAPWREAGVSALGQIQQYLQPGADVSKLIQADPGYNFRLNEGVKAVDRSAASRGTLFSGGTGKALARYGQDYASGEFSKAFDRLAAVAGIGQTATQASANSGNQFARDAGGNIIDAGNARATGALNQSGIQTGAIGSLAGQFTTALNQFAPSSYRPVPVASNDFSGFTTQPFAPSADFVNPLPTQVYG